MARVGAWPRRQFARRGTRLGIRNEDIRVVAAIWILVLVADECDRRAIGRPLGVVLVGILAGRQLLSLLGSEVIDDRARYKRRREDSPVCPA